MLGFLAIPIVLTVLAFVAFVARLRAVIWTLAILLLALFVLAAWSIGLFYIPSAVMLLIAAARMNPKRTSTDSPLASVGDQGGQSSRGARLTVASRARVPRMYTGRGARTALHAGARDTLQRVDDFFCQSGRAPVFKMLLERAILPRSDIHLVATAR